MMVLNAVIGSMWFQIIEWLSMGFYRTCLSIMVFNMPVLNHIAFNNGFQFQQKNQNKRILITDWFLLNILILWH